MKQFNIIAQTFNGSKLFSAFQKIFFYDSLIKLLCTNFEGSFAPKFIVTGNKNIG